MSTPHPSTTADKTDVMAIYESIFHQGELEGKFEVFRKGMHELNLDLEVLIQLTGISKEQAWEWQSLLEKNAEAPCPMLNG